MNRCMANEHLAAELLHARDAVRVIANPSHYGFDLGLGRAYQIRGAWYTTAYRIRLISRVLAVGGGARRRVQSPSEGRHKPAIQIACRLRKTERFPSS